jgi:hypothetical protein
VHGREATFFEERFERVARLILAVNQGHLPQGAGFTHRLGIGQEVVLAGMRAETV